MQDSARPRFYVTTPIYYVNDLPHIGHIYTTLIADTVARYRRMAGDEVRFLTGTDEHGQNIERAAAARGVQPIALADEVVERYHQLWKQLDVTHDDFIRTSQPRHHRGVEAIIARMKAAGDLYTGKHEGWYCPGCETFYTEKELVDGKRCPVHDREAEWQSEENVFFRLSKYQEPLLRWMEDNPGCIRPKTRANEVRAFIESGLKDLSVSRTQVRWGVPFPGHPGNTVYVWLEALTNYISALGFGREGEDDLYQHFWDSAGTRLHLVGKDILRFHAVFWPAFLMSAGLPLPSTIFAHGWWLRDDRKMSKSVGNVVRPDHLMERFGNDSLRYFLLREMVFGQDASFSDESFVDRYNSDLANDLGNTISRLVTLSRRLTDGHTPSQAPGGPLQASAEEAVAAYRAAMDDFAFHRALEALWKLLSQVSQYLVSNEPWKKLKDPSQAEEVGTVLSSAMEATRIVVAGLMPIMPERAPALQAALASPTPEGDPLAWGGLALGAELPATQPLFPRIDRAAFLKEIGAVSESKSKKTSEPSQAKQPKAKAAAGEIAAPPAKQAQDGDSDTPPTGERAKDERLNIDEFFRVELRVAKVLEAEPIKKSNKLLKLSVDVGEGQPRTVVAGIAKDYEASELVGRQVVVVANLKPAKLMGVESNGMVLAASVDGRAVLVQPQEEVAPGTRVR